MNPQSDMMEIFPTDISAASRVNKSKINDTCVNSVPGVGFHGLETRKAWCSLLTSLIAQKHQPYLKKMTAYTIILTPPQ